MEAQKGAVTFAQVRETAKQVLQTEEPDMIGLLQAQGIDPENPTPEGYRRVLEALKALAPQVQPKSLRKTEAIKSSQPKPPAEVVNVGIGRHNPNAPTIPGVGVRAPRRSSFRSYVSRP